jgi:hypothetical protein
MVWRAAAVLLVLSVEGGECGHDFFPKIQFHYTPFKNHLKHQTTIKTSKRQSDTTNI